MLCGGQPTWRAALRWLTTLLAIAALALTGGCTRTGTVAAPPSATTSTGTPVRVVTSEGTDTSKHGRDPGGLWAAVDHSEDEWLEVDDDPVVLLEHQRAWARAVLSDFPASGDITCDPRTFMPLRDFTPITIGVTGQDTGVLKQVLKRAEDRLYRVTFAGVEVDDPYDGSYPDTEDYWTVAYLSDPESSGLLAGISNIDTEGERYPWLFRTYLRIVAEELRAAGAVPARIVPYDTPEVIEELAGAGESYPTDEELGVDIGPAPMASPTPGTGFVLAAVRP